MPAADLARITEAVARVAAMTDEAVLEELAVSESEELARE
jgi:hypothetical protein